MKYCCVCVESNQQKDKEIFISQPLIILWNYEKAKLLASFQVKIPNFLHFRLHVKNYLKVRSSFSRPLLLSLCVLYLFISEARSGVDGVELCENHKQKPITPKVLGTIFLIYFLLLFFYLFLAFVARRSLSWGGNTSGCGMQCSRKSFSEKATSKCSPSKSRRSTRFWIRSGFRPASSPLLST